MTNKAFASSDHKFLEACKGASIEPSSRQASKFRRKKGKSIQKDDGASLVSSTPLAKVRGFEEIKSND